MTGLTQAHQYEVMAIDAHSRHDEQQANQYFAQRDKTLLRFRDCVNDVIRTEGAPVRHANPLNDPDSPPLIAQAPPSRPGADGRFHLGADERHDRDTEGTPDTPRGGRSRYPAPVAIPPQRGYAGAQPGGGLGQPGQATADSSGPADPVQRLTAEAARVNGGIAQLDGDCRWKGRRLFPKGWVYVCLGDHEDGEEVGGGVAAANPKKPAPYHQIRGIVRGGAYHVQWLDGEDLRRNPKSIPLEPMN